MAYSLSPPCQLQGLQPTMAVCECMHIVDTQWVMSPLTSYVTQLACNSLRPPWSVTVWWVGIGRDLIRKQNTFIYTSLTQFNKVMSVSTTQIVALQRFISYSEQHYFDTKMSCPSAASFQTRTNGFWKMTIKQSLRQAMKEQFPVW